MKQALTKRGGFFKGGLQHPGVRQTRAELHKQFNVGAKGERTDIRWSEVIAVFLPSAMEFHDAFLSHACAPIPVIRRAMLGPDGGAAL